MSKLKLEQYVVGPVQTNCYFVIHEDTKEMVIIDPGDNAAILAMKIENQGYVAKAILLTHGHFDHATGARELADHFSIPIYASELEKETLEDPSINLSSMTGSGEKIFSADIYLKDEETVKLAGFSIRALSTPGHTAGGMCYYFPYEDVVFAGDTLFNMSVGRTDFPGGSMSVLVRSINEKLMKLPEKTLVYTGHGENTTIETERMFNPYL